MLCFEKNLSFVALISFKNWPLPILFERL